MNLRNIDLVVNPFVKNILKNVSKTTSFSVIAGGYLRDNYYRVSCKDIDIFCNSDLDKVKLRSLFSDWTFNESSDKKSNDEDDYEKLKEIPGFEIIELVKGNEIPVQIMLSDDYNSVSSVLDKFDYGFCQIAVVYHFEINLINRYNENHFVIHRYI